MHVPPGLPWTLLLPFVLLVTLRVRAGRNRKLEEYLSGGRGAELWPSHGVAAPVPGRWRLRALLLGMGGLALGVALAGPTLGTRTVLVPRAPAPVVLLLDVSRSMDVQDVPRGRLDAARIVARRVAARASREELALIAFAGEAYLLLPLSADRELLLGFLDGADSGLLSSQGTDLAAALREGTELLREVALPAGSTLLVLSDGEAHHPEEEILRAAREVRELGGIVSAVGVGTEAGGVVPPPPAPRPGLMPAGAQAETGRGEPWSRARLDLLVRLAEAGGGSFASGADPSAVTALLEGLAGEGRTLEGAEVVELPLEGWPWLLALAVLALSLELVLGTLPRTVAEGKVGA